MDNNEILKKNGGRRFDICLMNPPFSLAEDFLYKTILVSNKVVTVQPMNFLIGNRKDKKLLNLLSERYYEVKKDQKISDTFVHSGAKIAADTTIHYIDINKEPKLVYNDIEYDSSVIFNIRKYTGDKYIEQFDETIKVLYENDNLINHYKNFENGDIVDDTDWCIKIPKIRGNKGMGNGECIDFYSLISNNEKFVENDTIGTFKKLSSSNGKHSNLSWFISFKTKQELDNYINYIKSDFARTALYLLKTSPNVTSGRICRRIPWFDFSDKHFTKSPREIDDWLFKKYNISDEIRKCIEEILPDYYGIRK